MKISIALGSTRIGRNSPRVARALRQELNKKGIDVQLIDLKDWPIHQFDERVNQLPDAQGVLSDMAKAIKTSDSLILVTPEYNGSYSGSLKNFVDCFSKEEFAGKPIGVATVSTGKMGGIRAAYHLQQVVLGIGGYPISQMLLTAEVLKNTDEEGTIQTEHYQAQMDRFLNAFLDFTGRLA